MPRLSVIIPTRNRAKQLATALQSIEQSELARDHFEVLVIDNGSSDDTAQVASSAATRLQNLKVFSEPEPGLHAGRHRGLKEAQGDVLVYADDDIRALPKWLSTLDDIFSDATVAMAGGNNYPEFQGNVPEWLEELWSNSSVDGQMISSLSVLALPDGRRDFSPMYVWGCNFSIRKQVLLDAGGFHPDAMPTDRLQFRGDGETHVSQFVQNNGLRCVFDSNASVYHAVTAERMTIDYFRQRAFNQGVSDSYAHLREAQDSPGIFSHSRVRLRRLVSGLARIFTAKEQSPELRELDDALRAGYGAGYDWHQQQYRDSADVRAWVHRTDYFV